MEKGRERLERRMPFFLISGESSRTGRTGSDKLCGNCWGPPCQCNGEPRDLLKDVAILNELGGALSLTGRDSPIIIQCDFSCITKQSHISEVSWCRKDGFLPVKKGEFSHGTFSHDTLRNVTDNVRRSSHHWPRYYPKEKKAGKIISMN